MLLFRPLPDRGEGGKHAVGFSRSSLGDWGYLEQCPASFVSVLTILAFTWAPMPLPAAVLQSLTCCFPWAQCVLPHLVVLAPETFRSLRLLQLFSHLCVFNCAVLGFDFLRQNPINFLSFGNMSHFLLLNNVLD